MPTFSDGDDSVDAATMLTSPVSPGDMRSHLQNLLDDKEKQLQHAGTLGQQLLAQRMELEERIRQLQDLEMDAGSDDEDAEMSVRERYRDLADTVKQWDTENEQLSILFNASKVRHTHVLPGLLPNAKHRLPLKWTFRARSNASIARLRLQQVLLPRSHHGVQKMRLIVQTTLVRTSSTRFASCHLFLHRVCIRDWQRVVDGSTKATEPVGGTRQGNPGHERGEG